MRIGPLFLLASSLILASCASLKSGASEESDLAAPEIVESLPEEVGSFEYHGYRHFQDLSDGHTFRYINNGKHRMADIYVYPVAEENSDLQHDELVLGSTRATIDAIGDAVKHGTYANFNVVSAATQARGARTVARFEATYLRHNLASYTVVYQTEYEGTLLKIRLSMPDNESNRTSAEWDEFANKMFNIIVDDLNGESDTETDVEVIAEADSEI